MESQISSALSYDQVQELKSIDPDSWQNIPPPIKKSVSLIISQLLYLSDEQAQMRKGLKNEIDQTNSRLRMVRKELETDVERLDETKKQIREELDRIQTETSAALCDSEHNLTGFITAQDTVKDAHLTALEEQQNLLRIRNKQMQGNLESLKVAIQMDIQTLAKSVPPQLGKLHTEITAEIAEELKSIKKNMQRIDNGWQQADQEISEHVHKWTSEHIDQSRAESDSMNLSLKELKAALFEQHHGIETQGSALEQKMTEITEGIYAKMRTADTTLEQKFDQSITTFNQFHSEFTNFVNATKEERGMLRDCIRDAVIQGEVSVQRIKTEFKEASSVLADSLENRVNFVLSDVQNLCTQLDLKIIKECEKMFETQIREVKAKLAVPFI